MSEKDQIRPTLDYLRERRESILQLHMAHLMFAFCEVDLLTDHPEAGHVTDLVRKEATPL